MTSRKDLSVSERIAALQRGSSPQPGGRPTSPPGTPPNLPTAQRLKDKIAHFDALGSAPRPSGSFGLGAPAEHRTTSRELYGNRIPSVNPRTGRSVGSSKDLSLISNSSTSSLDRDAFARDSNHSNEGPEGNTSPATENSQASHKTEPANVPEIRRIDSMTEHWVDTLQSKPGLALNPLAAESSGVFAPPSPVPDSDDTPAPAGPSTPLTSTLIKHLGASSHVPSRLGAETPVSVMVETGSLADGEQPQLVPDDPGTIPPSPVVTGMQLLGLEDGSRAEGETTPTREDSEAGDAAQPTAPQLTTTSLAPPTASRPAEEGPNTPLARSVNVEGPVVVTLGNDTALSGLGISTGEKNTSQGGELTTTNLLQLNAETSHLAPIPVAPSGPSSIIVEPSSEVPSLRPSPGPEQQPGARTPEPASAITPKQGTSELPALAPGTLPLSAASLRLLEIEGGKKSGRSGTETPISILVETGSTDGAPRDLEDVEPPTATPAPASPANSYFEEPPANVVAQPVGTVESSASKAYSSSVNPANPEPDNRIVKKGLPMPSKTIPTIVTNVRYRSQTTGATSMDPVDSSALETPTNKTFARTSNTIHKARSRPDLSSTSMTSAPASTDSSNLAVPNAGLQRRATIGSTAKTPQRRRASRVPQMQLLPSGQWGVIDDDSDEEDTGGWAKVTVTRTKWS